MSISENNPNQRKDRLHNYAKYSGIGFQMAIIIAGGTYGGIKLDEITTRKFPLFTVIFSLTSVFIAIYLVIKQVSNNNEK